MPFALAPTEPPQHRLTSAAPCLLPFPAEFDRFVMTGQSLVVQIAPQEHIDVSRWLVGIEKEKNERVFFVDNVIKDSLDALALSK